MQEWLEKAQRNLAAAAGDDPSSYELGQAEIDDLLDLARLAARDSGERISAPLICYLVGLARGRRDTQLVELIDAVVGKE